MKVLLDVDGVLADFVGGACKLHGVDDPYKKPENRAHYNMQSLVGLDGPGFWEPMGEEFWANLEPTLYCHEIFDALIDVYGLENICLLTSPVRTLGCTRGKMNWIRKHRPEFARRFLIGPRKEFCAHPGAILFDDYEGNIKKFRAAGGRAFLIPALWNIKYNLNPLAALREFLKAERMVLDACH